MQQIGDKIYKLIKNSKINLLLLSYQFSKRLIYDTTMNHKIASNKNKINYFK